MYGQMAVALFVFRHSLASSNGSTVVLARPLSVVFHKRQLEQVLAVSKMVILSEG